MNHAKAQAIACHRSLQCHLLHRHFQDEAKRKLLCVRQVVSLNLHRRHLTSSQRAVVALEVEKVLAGEAAIKEKARKSADLTFQKVEKSEVHAAEQAAQLLNTNRQYVSDAKKIERNAPELLEDVRHRLAWGYQNHRSDVRPFLRASEISVFLFYSVCKFCTFFFNRTSSKPPGVIGLLCSYRVTN